MEAKYLQLEILEAERLIERDKVILNQSIMLAEQQKEIDALKTMVKNLTLKE
jgi:hypothetical protein